MPYNTQTTGRGAVWLARVTGGHEVAGSSPVAPIFVNVAVSITFMVIGTAFLQTYSDSLCYKNRNNLFQVPYTTIKVKLRILVPNKIDIITHKAFAGLAVQPYRPPEGRSDCW